jgi:hypothetical protein
MGLAAFLVLSPWSVDRPTPGQWFATAAIPLGAAALLSPWLVRLAPLVAAGVRSPFETSWTHAWVMLGYHGFVGPIAALLGAALVVRRRAAWGLAMVGWWIATLDLSTLGLLEKAFPALRSTIFRFNYPFSLAWHAPILPYLGLTAAALVKGFDRWKVRDVGRATVPFAFAGAAVLGVAFAARQPLLAASKPVFGFQGALASSNDLLAMRWLRDHTPPESRILNYPGDYEGMRDWEAHWAPVISERDCVYFRWQPFFIGREPEREIREEQRALLAFWRDPAEASNEELLRRDGIGYVLVPESIGDPGSLGRAWRWAPPARLRNSISSPSEAAYLELAFAAGGAQVYQVLP